MEEFVHIASLILFLYTVFFYRAHFMFNLYTRTFRKSVYKSINPPGLRKIIVNCYHTDAESITYEPYMKFTVVGLVSCSGRPYSLEIVLSFSSFRSLNVFRCQFLRNGQMSSVHGHCFALQPVQI